MTPCFSLDTQVKWKIKRIGKSTRTNNALKLISIKVNKPNSFLYFSVLNFYVINNFWHNHRHWREIHLLPKVIKHSGIFQYTFLEGIWKPH